jgi:hypothetical protein
LELLTVFEGPGLKFIFDCLFVVLRLVLI